MTIKDLRIKYSLTQEALAKLTGIPKRTIENWEEGSSHPKGYILTLLSYFLEQKEKEAQ